MGTPYIGELRIISWNYAPKGWAFCNGQLLAINQNQALFSLLGTTYGGNGQTTFALPNLQGRTALHVGVGMAQGQVGGESNHTLSLSELPSHTHPVTASSNAASKGAPGGNRFAVTSGGSYASSPNVTLRSDAVSSVGGGTPHNNLSPYLVCNVIIALTGIFPSRN